MNAFQPGLFGPLTVLVFAWINRIYIWDISKIFSFCRRGPPNHSTLRYVCLNKNLSIATLTLQQKKEWIAEIPCSIPEIFYCLQLPSIKITQHCFSHLLHTFLRVFSTAHHPAFPAPTTLPSPCLALFSVDTVIRF